MSIFTSLWFWILVVGILLTIAGVIAWAVTGNADVLVGILLGAGVAWIIGGLLIWIFGRSKKPEVPPVPTMPPGTLGAPGTFPSTMSSYPSATMNANPSMTAYNPMPTGTGTSQLMTSNPSMSGSQQQLMELLKSNPQVVQSNPQLFQTNPQLMQSNPQLINSYSTSPKF